MTDYELFITKEEVTRCLQTYYDNYVVPLEILKIITNGNLKQKIDKTDYFNLISQYQIDTSLAITAYDSAILLTPEGLVSDVLDCKKIKEEVEYAYRHGFRWSFGDIIEDFTSVRYALILARQKLGVRPYWDPKEKHKTIICPECGRPFGDYQKRVKVGRSYLNKEQFISKNLPNFTSIEASAWFDKVWNDYPIYRNIDNNAIELAGSPRNEKVVEAPKYEVICKSNCDLARLVYKIADWRYYTPMQNLKHHIVND